MSRLSPAALKSPASSFAAPRGGYIAVRRRRAFGDALTSGLALGFAVVVGFCLCSDAQAQSWAGGGVCVPETRRCAQVWRYVDDGEKRRTIEGTIKAVRYNSKIGLSDDFSKKLATEFGNVLSDATLDDSRWKGLKDLIDDGDLTLFVDPDSENDRKNRSGDVVDVCRVPGLDTFSAPGQIEFEGVHISGMLLSFLKPGMRIRARGYFVEDELHCDKAELHPAYSIVAAEGAIDVAPELYYFHGLDLSDRFVLGSGSTPHTQELEIELLSRRDTLKLNEVKKGVVGYITETSVLDAVSGASDWSVSYPAPSLLRTRYTTTLNRGPTMFRHLDGFYIAKFTRGTRQRVTDGFSASLKQDAAGKYVEAKIEVELDADVMGGARPLIASRWWLDGEEVALDRNPPHKQTFLLRYAPATGNVRSTWTVSARGRTDDAWSEPVPFIFASDNPGQGVANTASVLALAASSGDIGANQLLLPEAGATTRHVVFFERDYVLGESSLTLAADDACADVVTVRATYNGVAGAALSPAGIRWYIGLAGSSVEITPAAPFANQWTRATLVDPTTLRVEQLVVSGMWVEVNAANEIGEVIGDKIGLGNPYACYASYEDPEASLRELFEHLYKAALVIEELRGRLPDPRDTIGIRVRRLPNLEELERRGPDARPLIAAYRELLTRLELSQSNVAPLRQLLDIGRRGRWIGEADPKRIERESGYQGVQRMLAARRTPLKEVLELPLRVGRPPE